MARITDESVADFLTDHWGWSLFGLLIFTGTFGALIHGRAKRHEIGHAPQHPDVP